MEELKKAIIDMVNGLDSERCARQIYYYVAHMTLLLQAEGGESHGDGRQEDLPAAL